MFRPNIRGFSKQSLRLGLFGWRIERSESFIKHRWPWRLSWVETIASDEVLTPVLARSGFVHLISKAGTKAHVVSAGLRRLRGSLLWFGSTVCVVSVAILCTPLEENQTKSHSPSPAVSPESCAALLQNPKKLVAKWLAGSESEITKITEENRLQLGGIQLRKVSIACGTQIESVQLTLIADGSAWRLKKFTRLEN